MQVIVGSGGFGREVAEMVCAAPGSRLVGFLDDDPDRHGTTIGGLPVLGGLDWLADRPGTEVFLGIGSARVKRCVATRLAAFDATFPCLVDPNARVGRRVLLGEGVVVCAGVILTCDITVGSFAALNLNATVGHDCELGAYVTVAPACNLSGHTVLEEAAELGTNVSTVPGVRVGAGSMVGAGAVVTRDVPPHVTAVGVPARHWSATS